MSAFTGTNPNPQTNQTVQLRDGRSLGYAEFGQPDGQPVLYFHGHPGARLEARFMDGHARELGVRLIGVDRPGSGLSTFQPDRRFLDWPDDVVELADSLRLDKFAVAGFSGGGPYALACAYKIPARLTCVAVVSGAGHTPTFLTFLSQWVPWIMLPLTGLFHDKVRAQKALGMAARSWADADQQCLRQPGFKELMAEALVEGLRQGSRGPAYEGVLLGRPWDFKLEEIDFPDIFLWHGEKDREVRVDLGRAVAGHLPHCTSTFYRGEGHISTIVNHGQEIMQALTAS